MLRLGNLTRATAAWARELTTHFAPALLPAWRRLRWKGIYMCLCVWPLRFVPLPVNVPSMGRLATREEFCNYLGNFCSGELRCDEVEAVLAATASPLVVDIGVNVGTTVRHWLCLNPAARVIGLDMMQEAIDQTTGQLQRFGSDVSWQPICGAVTDGPGEVELVFDDPLSGTNSIANAQGGTKRRVAADTLDHWIEAASLAEITLIKIDVEGHGVAVLAGATESLRRARFVALEIHSNEELEGSALALFRAGMLPFSISGRNTWWRKNPAPGAMG